MIGTVGQGSEDNRYSSSTLARFTTPDPYRASGGPGDPQSWNRYSYSRGDPVNRNDPSGLEDQDPTVYNWDYVLRINATSSAGDIYSALSVLDQMMYTQFYYISWWANTWSDWLYMLWEQQAATTAPPRDRELLPAANDAVKKALSDPDCRTLFSAAHDPYEVLMHLQAGDKYGSIKFEDKPADWGVADEGVTGVSFIRGLFGGKVSVSITINTYTPAGASGNSLWNYWNTGNASANAATLLHELGHAFNDLFGRGGSQFIRDTNWRGTPTASAQEFNANLLKTNCFKGAP